jgi:hypothetical protein
MLNATNTVVAGMAIALVGVTLALGFQQPSAPVGPHAGVGGSPSSTAEIAEAATSSAEAGQPFGSIGPGPWIAWERAPEFDGTMAPRPPAGYMLQSEGGGASRSNKHKPANGFDPLRLRVTKPDGSVESHTIDRNYRVSAWAALDDRVLAVTKPGMPLWRISDSAVNQFVKAGRRNEDCCEIQPDGTITTDGSGGLPRKIRFSLWRDDLEAIGFELGDITQPRHHWLWREGVGWTEVAGTPGRVRQIMGTPTGFYVVDVRGRVHHSPDGEVWQTLEEDDHQPRLNAAGDSVVIIDELGASLADPSGVRRLPFSEPIVARGGLIPGFGGSSHGRSCGEFHRPNIGTVIYDLCNEVLVLSPDGGGWGLIDARAEQMWVEEGDLIATLPGLGNQAFRAISTDRPPPGD